MRVRVYVYVYTSTCISRDISLAQLEATTISGISDRGYKKEMLNNGLLGRPPKGKMHRVRPLDLTSPTQIPLETLSCVGSEGGGAET